MDQLHNGYYLMNIYLRVYLVDVVLRVDESTESELLIEGSRPLSALVLAISYIVPCFVLYMVDWLEEGPLDLAWPIRKHHRVNLFRKYLNYSEVTRAETPV